MANKTLVLDDQKAKELYKTAAPEFRAMLEQSFGKAHFCSDMLELIKSFEDACEFNNTNPSDPRFTQGTQAGIAMEMLAEITKALNGGKVMRPDERRYYPWFEWTTSGFQFDGTRCDVTDAHAGSGPRLCTLNADLAAYMGKQFLHLYVKFFNC